MGLVRRLAVSVVGLLVVGSSVAFAQLPASAGPPTASIAIPPIGGGTIVFASEGDLWKVPATGGVAIRLTAYEGEERFPKLSPDGKLIAFTAQYEGNDDVYVMSATGGEPCASRFIPRPIRRSAGRPRAKSFSAAAATRRTMTTAFTRSRRRAASRR